VVLSAIALVLAGSTGPAAADVIPNTHVCQNFGSTNGSGARAGHCVDGYRTRNSDGDFFVGAQGQSFCQRASTGAILTCVGVRQTLVIKNRRTGETSATAVFRCGFYGGGSCPTGGQRFQNVSGVIRAYCNHAYVATITTLVYLPGTGERQSGPFSSDFGYPCV
jgi:hypothetical protein